MNINWEKWITDLLPLILRKPRIKDISFIIISPVISLWIDFKAWKKQIQTRMSITPQTIMLQKAIKDSLGIIATITEGNGRPADFIVKAPVLNMNKEKQLLALINRYKQAGKSYKYINTEIGIETLWSKYMCEIVGIPPKEEYEYQSQWGSYVCEMKMDIKLPINNIYVKCAGPLIYVRAQYPPASRISVNYDITYQLTVGDTSASHRSRGTVSYGAGTTEEVRLVSAPHEFIKILSADLTLDFDKDSTYFYFINKTIV